MPSKPAAAAAAAAAAVTAAAAAVAAAVTAAAAAAFWRRRVQASRGGTFRGPCSNVFHRSEYPHNYYRHNTVATPSSVASPVGFSTAEDSRMGYEYMKHFN